MRVSFFEEFPSPENLEKLKFIQWPSRLFLAARSLEEFLHLKEQFKNKYVTEIIYWPVLSKKEGYWFSPFSKRKALLRIFNEVKSKNVPVMIDAELPTTQNPILYFTQAFNFFRNRKILRNFVKEYPSVYVAEYFPLHGWRASVLKFLGVSFSSRNHHVIKMVYTSMRPLENKPFESYLKNAKTLFRDRFLLGLGVIATGVTGKEHVLSLKQLERDLELAKNAGIEEVVLFRLGGLDKEYARVCKRYS